MKTILKVLIIFISLGTIRASEEAVDPFAFSITFREIQQKSDVIGRWAFASEWDGYMGMALELNENGFRYWFMSDVGQRSRGYPVEGTWEIDKGRITLIHESDEHIYSEVWMLAESNGRIGLINPDDMKTLMMQHRQPTTRMMFMMPDSFKHWPVHNYPSEKTRPREE